MGNLHQFSFERKMLKFGKIFDWKLISIVSINELAHSGGQAISLCWLGSRLPGGKIRHLWVKYIIRKKYQNQMALRNITNFTSLNNVLKEHEKSLKNIRERNRINS